MSNLLLLFNHKLTSRQAENARTSLGVDHIIVPPRQISELWCRIPPDIAGLSALLAPVTDWIDDVAVPGDYILIQGDFGACFIMVQYSMSQGLLPVYSTTSRDAVEKHRADGSVEIIHVFRHVCFRQYGK